MTTLFNEGAEWLHPHEPPEDPVWPTPRDPAEVRVLLKRLPPRIRRVCLLTAVEWIQPRWTIVLPEALRAVPARVVATAWRWIEERISDAEMIAAESEFVAGFERWEAANVSERTDEVAAARWILQSVLTVQRPRDPELDQLGLAGLVRQRGISLADAKRRMVDATAGHGADEFALMQIYTHLAPALHPTTRLAFFDQWWKRCRCRLAFGFLAAI